jgi:hypothetical protein
VYDDCDQLLNTVLGMRWDKGRLLGEMLEAVYFEWVLYGNPLIEHRKIIVNIALGRHCPVFNVSICQKTCQEL